MHIPKASLNGIMSRVGSGCNCIEREGGALVRSVEGDWQGSMFWLL